MDWLKAFAFARRIAEAIAEGRIDAAAVKDMTDDQLAEFDAEAFQALQEAQARNEELAGETPAPEEPTDVPESEPSSDAKDDRGDTPDPKKPREGGGKGNPV